MVNQDKIDTQLSDVQNRIADTFAFFNVSSQSSSSSQESRGLDVFISLALISASRSFSKGYFKLETRIKPSSLQSWIVCQRTTSRFSTL